MLSVVKPSNEILLTSIFHPKEKKNRKLYSRFFGLKISDEIIEKALCVYGSGLFYLDDIFYDPRRIYNFSVKRYEGKLVLTGRARLHESGMRCATSVCLVPYGIIETHCYICKRRVSANDKNGYKKLCEHELATLMLVDDYLINRRKLSERRKLITYPFVY